MRPDYALSYAPADLQAFQHLCSSHIGSLPHRIARRSGLRWPYLTHAITRAFEEEFPAEVRVYDGYFGSVTRNYFHSWLVPRDDREWILDVCPIGAIGSPLLVDVGIASPWRQFYKVEVSFDRFRLTDLHRDELCETVAQIRAEWKSWRDVPDDEC